MYLEVRLNPGFEEHAEARIIKRGLIVEGPISVPQRGDVISTPEGKFQVTLREHFVTSSEEGGGMAVYVDVLERGYTDARVRE